MRKSNKLLLLIGAILASFLFFLTGCYGPNKAGKQVARALQEYPDTAASLIRDEFPCVDGKPDSTKFLKSIDTLKKLLRISSTEAKAYSGRLQQITDSLRRAQKNSGDDCNTLLWQATDYIAQCNMTKDSLNKALEDEKEIKRQILRWVDNIQPVIQPVEDSAKIRLLTRDRDKALMEANGWKTLYDQDHAWRVKQEKRMAGALDIYIPWWLIVLLAVGAGLVLVARIKKGVLNPLALFKKSKQ